RLADGSPVLLQAPALKRGVRGVLAGRDVFTVRVAVAEVPDELDDEAVCEMALTADETTLFRQKAALERARLADAGRFVELRSVLLGQAPPQFDRLPEITPFHPRLNPSQIEAIRFALAAKDVAVVHGPPRTGKT